MGFFDLSRRCEELEPQRDPPPLLAAGRRISSKDRKSASRRTRG